MENINDKRSIIMDNLDSLYKNKMDIINNSDINDNYKNIESSINSNFQELIEIYNTKCNYITYFLSNINDCDENTKQRHYDIVDTIEQKELAIKQIIQEYTICSESLIIEMNNEMLNNIVINIKLFNSQLDQLDYEGKKLYEKQIKKLKNNHIVTS